MTPRATLPHNTPAMPVLLRSLEGLANASVFPYLDDACRAACCAWRAGEAVGPAPLLCNSHYCARATALFLHAPSVHTVQTKNFVIILKQEKQKD